MSQEKASRYLSSYIERGKELLASSDAKTIDLKLKELSSSFHNFKSILLMMPLSFQSDFLSKYNKVLSEANKINEDVLLHFKKQKNQEEIQLLDLVGKKR